MKNLYFTFPVVAFPTKMTPEERSEMERLVRLIQDEKDHDKFTQLIAQLNRLLDRKERRLTDIPPKKS